jgi:hypothetical protein
MHRIEKIKDPTIIEKVYFCHSRENGNSGIVDEGGTLTAWECLTHKKFFTPLHLKPLVELYSHLQSYRVWK